MKIENITEKRAFRPIPSQTKRSWYLWKPGVEYGKIEPEGVNSMDDMKLLEAMRQIVKEEIKPINERLDRLEQGQEKLAADVHSLQEGQAKLEKSVAKLEQGQEKLAADVRSLQQGQEDIKRHITDNNVAIGEMFTQVLESTNEEIKTVKAVTANNLYKFEVLKLKEQG